MVQHRPSYVLFDVGNVLVRIEPAAFLRSLSIDTSENREYYQSKLIDIVKRYEKGDDSTEEFFANLDLLFNGRERKLQRNHGGKDHYSPDEFRNAMLSIVGAPVEGMEGIVRRIGTSVPLGLLSNTNPVHFDYCLQTFRVLQNIPTHFLSYQLKALKPEPEIFARVTMQIPFPPGEILYIDDLAENVDAARAAGFMGHQFIGVKNIEQLFSELKLI
ncbi:MAG: HAD-IA family hydrolase [Ignavibacteriales bacterium]|nr:HAD-IA family hydrolase [Ignavibacteriales bacterium]